MSPGSRKSGASAERRVPDSSDTRSLQAADPTTEPSSPDAIERRRRSELELRNRLIGWGRDPIAIELPDLPGHSLIRVVEPVEAAKRMLALFAVAVRGESMAGSNPISLSRIADRMPIGVTSLSTNERELLLNDHASLEQIDSMVWRYESVFALQWALQMQPDLCWPDQRCDLHSVSRLMLDLPHDDIVSQSRWRSANELTDAADLHFRAWWSVAVAQTEGVQITTEIDPGIVAERWQALAWICQLAPSPRIASWDDVQIWIDQGMPAGGVAK